MTPEQINVAIAEELGLRVYRLDNDGNETNGSHGVLYAGESPILNYFGSLDACAQFEKALTTEERSKYAKHLTMLISGFPFVNPQLVELHWEELFGVASATAPQRCEAFLKVRSKIQ